MTARTFRALALGPAEAWGVVMLTPEQQERLMLAEPKVFQSMQGAWGSRGATRVELAAARKPGVRLSLLAAWRNKAPRRLAAGPDEDWPR